MTGPCAPDAGADGAPPQDGGPGGSALLRWLAASGTLNVPQAAGPVAFSLVALDLTGEASGGAAMILAMTLAQVAGAIPVTRLGRRHAAATCLRLLVAFRTLALAAVALCVHSRAPFAALVVLAALAGLVNGAAFGHLRSLLNHLAPASRLPRALGIAATLNELTFVLGPVAASGLGSVSPVLAVLALTVVGAMPALLVPQVDAARVGSPPQVEAAASALGPAILLWLACAAAGGATVAAIEIGAVALALAFGHPPTLAILFTVPLCLASVAGGIWVSVRNRVAGRRVVVAQLSLMTLGAVLTALGASVAATIAGAVLIGLVLAPLGTCYSLALDRLAPPHRRAEVFALLRTANALGVIATSAMLTALSLSTTLIAVACAMAVVTATVASAPVARAGGLPR